MSYTNTLGYVPVDMEWTRGGRGSGIMCWDAEPAVNPAMRALRARVCTGDEDLDSDNEWESEWASADVENDLVGLVGMGDGAAMESLIEMLDWSKEGIGVRLGDDYPNRWITRGAIPVECEVGDATTSLMVSWNSGGSGDRGSGARRIDAAMPVSERKDGKIRHRILGGGGDCGTDVLRRLSEEDIGAQGEILEMIDCGNKGGCGVRVVEWGPGREIH